MENLVSDGLVDVGIEIELNKAKRDSNSGEEEDGREGQK